VSANITNVLTKELARLRKVGFNGVRFHELYISSDPKSRVKDFVSDGLTEAQAQENLASYCTIQINPDFGGDDSDEDTEYRETTYNIFKFHDDFTKHLKGLLGDDITITAPRPSCEFEVSRVGTNGRYAEAKTCYR
jgi:hypothetical protein